MPFSFIESIKFNLTNAHIAEVANNINESKSAIEKSLHALIPILVLSIYNLGLESDGLEEIKILSLKAYDKNSQNPPEILQQIPLEEIPETFSHRLFGENLLLLAQNLSLYSGINDESAKTILYKSSSMAFITVGEHLKILMDRNLNANNKPETKIGFMKAFVNPSNKSEDENKFNHKITLDLVLYLKDQQDFILESLPKPFHINAILRCTKVEDLLERWDRFACGVIEKAENELKPQPASGFLSKIFSKPK